MSSTLDFLQTIPIIRMLEENQMQDLIKNLNVKSFFKNESKS